VHLGLGLAHGQPANGIALKADFNEPCSTYFSQLLIYATLHNAKISVPRLLAKCLARSRRPAQGKLHGLLGLFLRVRIFEALVELHLNVRTKHALNVHGTLRRKFISPPVDMRLERCPLLRDLANLRKGHHLEPTAIGKYRSIPSDEFMQATELCHLFRSWPQHQMVGIAQNDIGARLLHLIEVKPFHRADGSYRHEGGGANVTMQRMDRSQPRRAIRLVKRKGKLCHAA